MKSYLSLIPISARVRKRQNKMTLLCIIFAVFLVTAVFSMAEMGIRMEKARLLEKHSALSIQDISSSEMGQSLLLIAAVLFLLILIAGVLMISSSINSNVAKRTKFFGMMRCIGMSKQQIINFVRLEALSWCKIAVPIGVALGIVTTWGLCAVLRFVVGEEFSSIPLFGVSMVGIISGVIVGIITVLIAAASPAKHAAKVSPVAAVSGDSNKTTHTHHTVNTHIFKIETALGIQHAMSVKKNLALMIGSFALSIILFLCFSVLIDFVGYLMPQSYGTADIEIASNDGSNSLEKELLDLMSSIEGVKRVFGRRSLFDVSAELDREDMASSTIDIISYDDFDLDCLKKDGMLKRGSDISKVYGDSNYVLATWDKESPWKIGDIIQIGAEKFEIAGLLKYDPFNSDGATNGKITLITSGETFSRLSGVSSYSLIMVQTNRNATDKNVERIRGLIGNNGTVNDKRGQRTAGTYLAFVFCVYSFLAIIALVTALNIINSISMSVSARVKQYGTMRAVGMDKHQITKMIIAEAFTYALSGCIVGCTVGLLLSKLLYDILITAHFSYANWSFPVTSLLIILVFVFLATTLAICTPSKRLRNMEIAETINEL